MADLTSWIGGTLKFAVAARDDAATSTDYTTAESGATELGIVLDIGEIGTTSSAINISPLKTGFVIPLNGEKTGGDIAVSLAYDASDSSYSTLRAKSNSNDTVWFFITDPDGEKLYLQGIVADFKDTARNTTTQKGATFVIRQNVEELRA